MSTSMVIPTRPVLVDAVVPNRRLVTDLAFVVGGATLVAGLAQVAVPLWPVPVTGQTLGVVITGAALGSRRGALSMALYMGAGLMGLPVFAGFSGGLGMLIAPSFGFILGFVASAYIMGWFAERHWDQRFWQGLAGFLLASAVPFLLGVPYMALVLARMGYAHDFSTVMELGVYPFIPGGIVKAVIAAGAVPMAWRLLPTAGNVTKE